VHCPALVMKLTDRPLPPFPSTGLEMNSELECISDQFRVSGLSAANLIKTPRDSKSRATEKEKDRLVY